MLPSESVDVLESAAASFAELLGAGPLTAPVRSCPGWTMADLGRHLGGIHRWAHTALVAGKPGEEPPGPDDPAEIKAWFRAGAATLVQTLRSCDPDQNAWTFGAPRTARFWMRRQAHETTIHAWDAATCRGREYDIDDELAEDGIDEVVTMFLPRQVRLGRLAPGPEVVELRTPDGFRTVVAPDANLADGPVTATVTGPAVELLLLLWKRVPVSDPRLTVNGSMADAQRLFASSLTP